MNSESVKRYWLSMYDKHGSVSLYLLLHIHAASFHNARLLLSNIHRHTIPTAFKIGFTITSGVKIHTFAAHKSTLMQGIFQDFEHGGCEATVGGPLPFPSSPLAFLSLSLLSPPSLLSSSPPLEVGPLNPAKGSGGAL